MKYIITESQFKLISELERTWRDFEYENDYNKIKDKVVPYIANQFDFYDFEGEDLYLYDSDKKLIAKFHFYEDDEEGLRGELYFSRDHDELLEKRFPHPFWMRHGKYLVSDAFNILFPEYKVLDVRTGYLF
jgi:hypothetical protein